jgi:tripartite-type tricarboxylate transporter receptor subunit TctC
MKPRRKRFGTSFSIVAPALFAMIGLSPALAQKEAASYPARVVTLVNPFAPGAATDIIARLIAQKLTDAFGRSVVVDNRPGASGTVGLAQVAKAAPDGHLLAMIIITHASAVALQGNKAVIDLVRDFTPITQVASQPYLLIVNSSLPVRSIRDLVALAKARPGMINYGSSGVGSVLHLAGELLALQTNIRISHVPYKGAALALTDVAGGHIAMLFTTRMSAQPLIAKGRVRAIAVTSTERVPGLPEVATVAESGITGPFEVNGWYGIGGPAGMPAPLVERLNEEIHRVLKAADVRERMISEGAMPNGSTPAQFGELVRADVEKWRRTIQRAGISPG